jgi:uncharacterized protein YbjT (DUF2867 family)
MSAIPERIALLAGASGLVGSRCLARLLGETQYTRVITLTRRPLPHDDPKLEQRVVEFDRLGTVGVEVPRATDVFCCLGTTMRQAGSEAAFRQVDFTYVVSLASMALGAGARQFLLVSSLGASPKSRIFYSRVKERPRRRSLRCRSRRVRSSALRFSWASAASAARARRSGRWCCGERRSR